MAAINRADRQAAETGRTWYVLGNGLGHYWTNDTRQVNPMSGALQYAHYQTS